MKVLVTGASGFFGRAMVAALEKAREFEVIARYRLHLDIRYQDDVKEEFRSKPNIVVNCAGITGLANCTKNPQLAWQTNVLGVANLVAFCREISAVLVNPSTVAVFNGLSKHAYKEDDDPCPIKGNIYSETKTAAEWIVRSSDIEYLLPRITTGYGPIDPHDTTNFVKIVANQLREPGTSVSFFADQYTNPICTEDAAEAIVQCLQQERRGIIHLGGTAALSMYEFARAIKMELRLSRDVSPKSIAGTNYPGNMLLSTEKAESFGIRSRGLESTLQHCRPTRQEV